MNEASNHCQTNSAGSSKDCFFYSLNSRYTGGVHCQIMQTYTTDLTLYVW